MKLTFGLLYTHSYAFHFTKKCTWELYHSLLGRNYSIK